MERCYLIFYTDKAGSLRAARTFSYDQPERVREYFLYDFPNAQKIVDLHPVSA